MPDPSSHPPQIAWRFLAGGPDGLRLSLSSAAVVVGGGAAWLLIASAVLVFGDMAPSPVRWPSVLAAILAALLIAALVARWLGNRLGVLVGLVQLTSMYALGSVHRGPAEMLFCAAVTAAMGLFALGNVPGRLPLVDRRATRWAFYAAVGGTLLLAGPIGPAFVLAGCVPFLILCADSRGIRFLADPLGITLCALLMGLTMALPGGLPSPGVSAFRLSADVLGPRTSFSGLLGLMAWGSLPWTPLAALAVVVGLRQGHSTTPIWRFFGCWLLGPLTLMGVVGRFGYAAYFGALLPPLAAMGAVGLSGLLVRSRRVRGYWR